MTTIDPTRARGVVLVLGSITSLQLGAAFSRLLFDELGPAGVSALRLGIAGLVMTALVRPRVRGWTRRQWWGSVQLGLCVALMNMTFYEAVARVPLGVAIAVQFTGPLVIAAASSRRVLDALPVVAAAAGVGIFGLQASGEGADLQVAGVLLALLAGGWWACYILAASRVASQFSGLEGLAVATLVAGLVATPIGVTVAGADLVRPHALAAGAGIALLASVLPYACEMVALRTMPKRVFSILVALEPAVGVAAGLLVLGQHLSAVQGAAVALIVGAALAATVSGERKPMLPG